MSKLEDFKVGVRVKHDDFGEGVIDDLHDGLVVTFDNEHMQLHHFYVGCDNRSRYFPLKGSPYWLEHLELEVGKLKLLPDENILEWFNSMGDNNFVLEDTHDGHYTVKDATTLYNLSVIRKSWPFDKQKDAILKLMEIYR